MALRPATQSSVWLLALVLLLAVVKFFSTLDAAAAGVFARLDGATYSTLLQRAPEVFGASFTLSLVVMTFVRASL
ncbi:hypothetical protein [Streptomyces sp. NPDC056983]|uniref:hypothetical protein n=1 Tax=Streptomyces sp. NPDC056983 TaxID=3345987 RepID=UPI00363B0F97